MIQGYLLTNRLNVLPCKASHLQATTSSLPSSRLCKIDYLFFDMSALFSLPLLILPRLTVYLQLSSPHLLFTIYTAAHVSDKHRYDNAILERLPLCHILCPSPTCLPLLDTSFLLGLLVDCYSSPHTHLPLPGCSNSPIGLLTYLLLPVYSYPSPSTRVLACSLIERDRGTKGERERGIVYN